MYIEKRPLPRIPQESGRFVFFTNRSGQFGQSRFQASLPSLLMGQQILGIPKQVIRGVPGNAFTSLSLHCGHEIGQFVRS